VVLSLLGLALPLAADPIITVTMGGEVTGLVDALDLLSGVATGDPVSISFSYKLSLPDGDPEPTFGIYQDSVVSATASVGAHVLSFSQPFSTSLSFISGPGTHGFLALGSFDSAAFLAGPNLGMMLADVPALFAVQLLASFGGVLPNDELIVLPTSGWDTGHGQVSDRSNSLRLGFRVDLESIQTTVTQPVPEAEALLLVGSGLLALLWARRRRIGTRHPFGEDWRG
jgi:hypothetical protein